MWQHSSVSYILLLAVEKMVVKDLSEEHLVIVRTCGSIINLNTYNCQELGLAKVLVKKGLRVTLIIAGKTDKRECIDGVDVVHCLFKALNQPLAWFLGLDEILRKLSPTLIQVHDMGMFMTWWVVRWSKRHKIPVFLIQGNYMLVQKPVYKQIEWLINISIGRYVLKNVTGIGCKTLMASRYVRSYYERDTSITRIGLDVSKFTIGAVSEDWRKRHGCENKKLLLYVGSMASRRNPLFLLDILLSLPDDYILVMVGSGPLENEIHQKIEHEQLQGRCLMLGMMTQGQLAEVYASADLFLFASNSEIYGMVMLEAMFFGVPVVTTRTAGSETLIQNGKNGYIVDSLVADDWKSKIMQICEDKPVLEQMKIYAQKYIKEELVWDKAADRFLSLYFKEKKG